jgi:hypothetical protein
MSKRILLTVDITVCGQCTFCSAEWEASDPTNVTYRCERNKGVEVNNNTQPDWCPLIDGEIWDHRMGERNDRL